MRAVVGLALCVLLAGCSLDFSPTDVEVPVEEAEAFGRIDIPAGLQVLEVRMDRGIDTRYRVALRVSERDVETILRKSKFTEHFLPVKDPSAMTVIAGPPLSSATKVMAAQGHVEKPWVYRDIVQDIRSSDEVYLHISLFNT
ncbi:hypothetical protein DE4585_00444 [Mycobacteroides salmoniphilum]|uniref:Uncharacterized protein n=1 Tax=Mycobacteroides salmoniphilum TaxID=404941 RepID=A0A4R8S6X8_9MYCO|nr:hypothetical protein [Mycobacteroides salmoniphilum]TDZ80527.1 hypothetical protein DE4586_00464 [Mycobacteroides salmoniphilum]TDZ87450.1 hypothetical protein DE4585_00444 [Mycobacteroides salmoniphilum]TDZ88027.1 hypothetical protein DE4587_00380 [Mycobacteroides salmoniphilum]